MDLGVCVASHIGDIDYVVRAEELGFTHAWLADSQMLWSDCYATLALAATRTKTIKIGTGVAVTGTRSATVTAAGIGTINALAPGRTFLGVGTGNTAMRTINQPPQRLAQFRRYLAALQPLLRGEEAALHESGTETAVRHLMPETGFVDFDTEIPMYVSGFGPKALGLAGRFGDGAVVAMPPAPAVMDYYWRCIEAGRTPEQTPLDRDTYYTTALTTISILDPGEDADAPRIRAECGAFAMAALHYAYDQWRQFGQDPPTIADDFWDEYCAMLDAVPAEKLHQRIHAGHNCWVLPEEEKFLRAEMIEATCMVGTADDVCERLLTFDAAGLDQVMVLPAWEPRYRVLDRVGRDLLPRLTEAQN